MSIVREIRADNLKVYVCDSRRSLGELAAQDAVDRIMEILKVKSEINIVFASAPSQNEFLEALIGKEIAWKKINAFHLDEYIGLDPEAPQGFGNFLKDRIFSKIKPGTVNYLNGNAGNIEEECRRYSDLLVKYPLDLAFLGIGENGHIAFNDPPVAQFKDSRLVKPVKLDERCRLQQVNDGCFDTIQKVPTDALTLTVPAIMAAKHIICIVPSRTKAEAIFKTVTGEIDEACPASIIRTHSDSVLYTDLDSASMIIKR